MSLPIGKTRRSAHEILLPIRFTCFFFSQPVARKAALATKLIDSVDSSIFFFSLSAVVLHYQATCSSNPMSFSHCIQVRFGSKYSKLFFLFKNTL